MSLWGGHKTPPLVHIMKIRNVSFSLLHNNNVIWSGDWRIPEYSFDEINVLKTEFINKFDTSYKDVISSLGIPTDIYEWISSKTGIPYSKCWYVQSQTDANQIDTLKNFFPIADFNDNVYLRVTSETPDVIGTFYNKLNNIIIKSGESIYNVGSLEFLNPNVKGSGYDCRVVITNNSNITMESEVFAPGESNNNNSAGIFVPYRIVNDNGDVIGCGVHEINTRSGTPSKNFITNANSLFNVHTYTSSDLNIPYVQFFSGDYPSIDPTDKDPYKDGGESGTGGGTGNFDGTSENIEVPELPSLSAVDTGFITLFNPSAGELKNLANYMWGDVFDISTWKKIFADPMDAILGLSIVPVNVPSAGSANVTIGNISTGISMTKASSQYVSVDCGTINVNEYWGAYLDYSPYTKAEIYLPFVGTHPVTIDDIMGKPVHVVYHVDVLSGACCAYVQCGGSVLYSFVGQCSCSIPVTANDWTNVINGALSIAGSIGTMVATGGATAPMAVTNITSTAVNSLKPDVEKSGSMGGMGGMLGVQKPYIILTRPRQALPARQNSFTGYPSFITKTLSHCSGYTEVESIHLENVPATQNELDEITELLKSGVII